MIPDRTLALLLIMLFVAVIAGYAFGKVMGW